MGDDPATLPSRVPLGLYPQSTTCAGPGPVDIWKIKMGYIYLQRMGGLWRLNNSSMGFNQPIWIWTNKTMGTLRFDRRKWRIFLDFQTIVKGGLWGVYVCMWLILFGWWHHCIVVAQAFCWGVLVDFGATFRLRPFSRMRLGLVVVVRVYVSVLC
jgi:hypothetical protein